MSDWLDFEEHESTTGKTKVFTVYSKGVVATLGLIKWNPPWRHYCFFPTLEYQTVWSDRCLQDVSEFVKKLNDEQKRKDFMPRDFDKLNAKAEELEKEGKSCNSK